MNFYSIILISMIASITMGVIDGLSFLLVEDEMTNFWKKHSLDEKTIPLINGGISAAISILIAVIVEKQLEKHYKLLRHPAISATGIIIGTILVIFAYKIYGLKIVQNPIKNIDE